MTNNQKKWIGLLFALFMLILVMMFISPSIRASTQEKAYLKALESLPYNTYLNTSFDPALAAQTPEWDVYQFSSPELQCVRGGDFGVLVHKGIESDKTVLWLQPGTECWPNHPLCGELPKIPNAAELGLHNALSSANSSPFGPIQSDKNNPMANWNYVYVPSCDGSFYLGDSTMDYDGDGMPDHWHNGLRQTAAAVSLMKELFPETQKILIAGSSAGGFGTFSATPISRLAFPDARLVVFNDSGPGIMLNPERPKVWAEINQTWNLSSHVPADCPNCANQLIYLYDWYLTRDPNLKIGMFTSYRDLVVSSVVSMDGVDYQKALMETSSQISNNHPNTFKRYFINGDSHTIGDYYRSDGGEVVWDWITYLVNDDPRWRDVLE
jgi:hypothetical protein